MDINSGIGQYKLHMYVTENMGQRGTTRMGACEVSIYQTEIFPSQVFFN